MAGGTDTSAQTEANCRSPMEKVEPSNGEHTRSWRGYVVALATATTAILLTLVLHPAIEPSVFPLFYAAVMVTAWYGGLGPGLLATIVAVAAIESLFIRNPQPLWYLHGYVRLSLFVAVALLISSLTAARKRAEEALRKAHGELELRVQERTADLATVNENLRIEIRERERTEKENQKLLHDLGERVKELTALHSTAHLLQNENITSSDLLREIANSLPAAWQYPENTAACVSFDGVDYKTPNFGPLYYRSLRADFATLSGRHGSIEVLYLEPRPPEAEGPFLAEEKTLVESLAEMLESYFQRREAAAQVSQVSRELIESNRELWRLQSEIRRVEPLAALGRVTGTIAHELGTPLNSVLGYTQLLAQDELSENARRRLDIIKLQVERMVQIINHYLTNVRSAFQKQQSINVNDLIAETLVMLRPILQQHQVQVHCQLASSLPPLIADGPSLQRVLINLLDNSIDAMKSGGMVSLMTQASSATGSTPPGTIIMVCDTGTGILAEVQPRIFDMFVTTKAAGQGSGLGLAICQEIVKGHGGTIEITSEAGKGTCARVFLPAAEQPTCMNASGPDQ